MRSTSGALPVELSTWRTRSGVSIRALLWEAALLRLPHYGWLHLRDQTQGGRLNSERKAWRHRFVLLLPGQLRLFASHIRDGAYLDRRVDAALPDRKPAPRPARGALTAARRTPASLRHRRMALGLGSLRRSPL